ncbi:hypothetical protein C8J55DRAFT_393621, partial [Lentinula edodes]
LSSLSPLDLELVGIIVETMSLSRSSSHLALSLYKTVCETRSSGTAGMSETDIMWVSEFERVMTESAARYGMFGMVESSFRNSRNLPLPFSSRFFYVPDCDPDVERAQLIRLTMPGSGKRSETKKYKQYYWKPVGK